MPSSITSVISHPLQRVCPSSLTQPQSQPPIFATRAVTDEVVRPLHAYDALIEVLLTDRVVLTRLRDIVPASERAFTANHLLQVCHSRGQVRACVCVCACT